jgi:alpha/beta superfamily hydrolase
VRLDILAQRRGRLSIPQRALYDLDLQDLELGRSRIRFQLDLAGRNLTFRGRLDAERGEPAINGRFIAAKQQREADAPPLLSGEILFEKIPGKDVPYREEEVSFRGAVGILSGTLTLPTGQGPFPAAVLLSPEGPHNRDAEIRGLPLFAWLADLLTRQGIAVLRCDDRGIGRSEGRFESAGITDFADDGRSSAAYLGGRSDIRSVGYIGLGEGGLAAIFATLRETDPPAFLILLSAPFKDFPLLEEIRKLSCPLLSIWGGEETSSAEAHNASLLRILEESDHPDYAVVRIREGDEEFLAGGQAFIPRFEELLIRWLSFRTGSP